MEAVKNQTTEKVATYDPNKKYVWTQQDTFTLSGAEFGILLNTLRAILNTQEASRILLANQSNNILEELLANAVESGIVKEADEQNS